ncbi:MAG: hypothetical protein ACHBNF_07565 [Chromatiales bacterium]
MSAQGSEPLLPPLESLRQTARHIAVAVVTEARNQELAEATSKAGLERRIDQTMWLPAYVSLR